MSKFIEEFYYGNIDPQTRSTKQNQTVQKQIEVLMLNEEFLTEDLRVKTKRSFLISSMLGVSSINRAANIRKIEPFEDSILMFEKLLPLMNVTFVHNGQLTIIPFPFKYLREYVKG